MKCDHCDNEATIHEVSIKAGKKVEKHLCERCAANAGFSIQSAAPIAQLLTQFVTASNKPKPVPPPAEGAAATPATRLACGDCGLTFVEFRQNGLLGCAGCYAAFEEQLGPLLERAHEGGTHHVGKVPRSLSAVGARSRLAARPLPAENWAKRAEILRRQLEEAVAGEQYEQAAAIRDEIARLQTHITSRVMPVPGPSGEAAPPTPETRT